MSPFVRVGMGRVLPESPNACILQCFASELVLAVFRGLSPNSRELVLDQCKSQCFQKSFAFEMPKRFLAIYRSKERCESFTFIGEVVLKQCQKFCVFPFHVSAFVALTHPIISTWGDEDCLLFSEIS